jgi:hypothetical protein
LRSIHFLTQEHRGLVDVTRPRTDQPGRKRGQPGSKIGQKTDRKPPLRPRRPGKLWGFVRSFMMLTVMLTLVLAAVAGVIYVRISHGPISFKFLAGPIERGITAELTGFDARVEDATIAMSPDGTVELRLVNLRLSEADGDVVAIVPTAAIELSRPALLAMRIVPSRIDLIGARLSLVYSNSGGLSLSFMREGQPPTRAVTGANPSDGAVASQSQTVDLAVIISEATARARKRQDSTSYLNQIGVREGVVLLDDQGVRSEWAVTSAVVDFDHRKKRSIVSGQATLASARGPWSLTFHTEESEKTQTLLVKGTLKDLVPRVFGTAIPQLSLLETLDAPVSGEGTLELDTSGVLQSASLALTVGRGQFQLPTLADVPFGLDMGQLNLNYDGSTKRIELAPSAFVWGTSHVTLGGAITQQPSASGVPTWTLDLATREGVLSAEEFKVAPFAIDMGVVKGRFAPSLGEITLDTLTFKAGGAHLQAKGQFLTGVSAQAGSARLDATLGPTSVDTFKVLWPRALAHKARNWVGQRIGKGHIKAGTLSFVSGAFATETGGAPGGRQQRLSVAMEAVDITANPLKWMSPLEAPRALIRLENDSIEIVVPEAAVVLGPKSRVPLKAGRFASPDLDAAISHAEITFRGLAPLVPTLEVLDQSPLHVLRANGITTEGIDGKVDAAIKLEFPLIADLNAEDVKITGTAKVSDGKIKQLGGAFDIQGGLVALDITEQAIDAKGTMLVNGVPAKLAWQRIIEQTGEKQPPLRISATLDNADRTQLGMDVNHIVQGEVPVEVTLEKGVADETIIRLRADLTSADIGIDSIAWHKAPGRTATLQTDIVKGKVHKTELQNLKIVGDDMAIEGWAAINTENKLVEIHLPGVSLNLVSRLEVQGQLKQAETDKTGVWLLKVRGATFDGRDMFKSMFSVGQAADKVATKGGKASAGIDLDAEIDNVIGFSDVSLRGLKLKLSRRGEKLSSLDARATLDGGAPMVATMTPVAGEARRLLADTTDAGQAFKLIGFYPNMQSGRARLEVNVDGKGAAEKTGILWVEDFRILGDPVVAEVLGTTATQGDESAPSKNKKRGGPQREVFDFDRMKVPFSVGYNQFGLDDAYLRGPLLGVSIKGKADFKHRTLNLGGTYIPLQGLNNALGGVPLLGNLVSGTQGEGAFGITFAVQGPMAQPQVLVNPLSLVAPGIFRDLFPMTNANSKIIARDEKGPSAPVEKRVRASSPPAGENEPSGKVSPGLVVPEPQPTTPQGSPKPKSATPRAPVPKAAAPKPKAADVLDGWSSQTLPPRAP